jgi:hypothetical protein
MLAYEAMIATRSCSQTQSARAKPASCIILPGKEDVCIPWQSASADNGLAKHRHDLFVGKLLMGRHNMAEKVAAWAY